MDNVEKIKIFKDKLREKIQQEMNGLVGKFIDYVLIEHVNYQKYSMVDGICHRINYGIDGNKYFCYLPETVEFIHRYNYWRTNAIYFNNNSNCWYLYNKDKKEFAEFNSLDTDTQIATLEILKNQLK